MLGALRARRVTAQSRAASIACGRDHE
jgi:hypothetical protein